MPIFNRIYCPRCRKEHNLKLNERRNEIACGKYSGPSPLKPIEMLAINTGMCRSEIMGLKWSNIDLCRDIIYLRRKKNCEKREIPLNTTVKIMLSEMMRMSVSEWIFAKRSEENYVDFKKSFLTTPDKSGNNYFLDTQC